MEFDITGITTFCMNDKYVHSSLDTLKGLYPTIPIVVTDNSYPGHICTKLLQDVADTGKIELIVNGENKGNGQGLTQALERVKTKYVLMFDSDVEFINIDLLRDMFALMDKDRYGVGFVMWHGINGETARPLHLHEERPKESMKYLHPFCALVSMENYGLYTPISTYTSPGKNKAHGAPMMGPMRNIYDTGNEHAVKFLPESAYVRCKYWNHTSGGARIALRELAK